MLTLAPTLAPLSAPQVHEPAAGATRARDVAPEAPAAPSSVLPNPVLRLDASLGLVVLEFRGADGDIRTIPNERELEAYRSAARGPRPGAYTPPATTGSIQR